MRIVFISQDARCLLLTWSWLRNRVWNVPNEEEEGLDDDFAFPSHTRRQHSTSDWLTVATNFHICQHTLLWMIFLSFSCPSAAEPANTVSITPYSTRNLRIAGTFRGLRICGAVIQELKLAFAGHIRICPTRESATRKYTKNSVSAYSSIIGRIQRLLRAAERTFTTYTFSAQRFGTIITLNAQRTRGCGILPVTRPWSRCEVSRLSKVECGFQRMAMSCDLCNGLDVAYVEVVQRERSKRSATSSKDITLRNRLHLSIGVQSNWKLYVETLCWPLSTVLPGDEAPLVGSLTFHEFGRYVGGGCAAIAIMLSLLLIWLHALNYTKPYEQRQ